MNDVAFILQPLELDHFYAILGPFERIAKKIISRGTAKLIIRLFPSFKLLSIKGINSKTGKSIDIHLVICPLLPEHMVSLSKKIILRKIYNAIHIAKNEGARVIELSSFISLMENDWENISRKIGINLTTGENFLAGAVLKQLEAATKQMGLCLKESTIGVISLSNPIGSLCAKLLSQVTSKILFSGAENEVMSECKIWLRNNSIVEVAYIEDVKDICKHADVILVTTSSLTTHIDSQHLKSGAILCDIGIPPLIAKNVSLNRKDVLAFDGRLIELPHSNVIENELWKRLFPKKGLLIFSRLAESLVLGFEGRFENFSLEKSTLCVEKAREIFQRGEWHGFEITPFRNGSDVMRVDEIKDAVVA